MFFFYLKAILSFDKTNNVHSKSWRIFIDWVENFQMWTSLLKIHPDQVANSTKRSW